MRGHFSRPQRGGVRRLLTLAGVATLFMLTVTNAAALITRTVPFDFPLNPIAFALLAPLALLRRDARVQPRMLFVAANAFVIVFAALGFLGPRANSVPAYVTAQNILKLWVALVGVPWTVARLGPEDGRRLLRAGGWVVAAGGVLAGVQYAWPEPFVAIVAQPGRGAGLWINPNNCAFICATYFFVWRDVRSTAKSARWVVPALYVVGIAASLSRGTLVAFVVALVYEAMRKKRLSTVAVGAAAALALYAVLNFVAPKIGDELEAMTERRAAMLSLLRGDVETLTVADNRSELWNYSLSAIADDWVLGLGHGSMNHIVPIGDGGLGPHNFYLYVLGNSGILALVAFLGMLWGAQRAAAQCATARSDSSASAVLVVYAICVLFDHSLPSHQFSAITFTAIAFGMSVARAQTGAAHAVAGMSAVTAPAQDPRLSALESPELGARRGGPLSARRG
jgi:O-antigen ligase